MSQEQSTNAHPTVLLVGFHPSVLEANMADKVWTDIKELEQRASHAGINLSLLGLKKDDAWKAELLDMIHSKKFDAVVIGNGVRSNIPRTHMFEEMIEVVRHNAPQARVLFSTSPLNLLEAVKRWFPLINYQSGSVQYEVYSVHD